MADAVVDKSSTYPVVAPFTSDELRRYWSKVDI